MNYLRRKFTYLIERFLLGGTFNLLIFISILIILTSILGGLTVHNYGEGEPFENLFSAIWWAFLRLSDPGYLGDDNGTIKRIIATVVTILGYVLFMGALVAIMTNWLHSKISSLEKGSTPISMSGHFVILGWSEETPSLIKEILTSGARLRRFLSQFGVTRAKVVVLTNDVDSHKMSKIQSTLGGFFSGQSVIFRSGSPLDIEDLKKVDPTNAAAIFIQKEDGILKEHNSDHCRVKTLKYLEFLGAKEIRTIIELEDQSHAAAVGRPGVTAFSPGSIAASIATTALSLPEATPFFHTLFVKNIGPSIFIGSPYEGRPIDFQSWSLSFENALLIGFTRDESVNFNPAPDKVVAKGDTPIFLTESLDDISASDLDDTSQRDEKNSPPVTLTQTHFTGPDLPAATIVGLDSFTQDHLILKTAEFFDKLRVYSNNNPTNTTGKKINLELIPYSQNIVSELIQNKEPTLVSTDLLSLGLHRDADTLAMMSEIAFIKNKQSQANRFHTNSLDDQQNKNEIEKKQFVFDFKDPIHIKIAEESGFFAISTTSIISHLLSQITLNEGLLPIFQSFFSKNRMSFVSSADLQIEPGDHSWKDIQKSGHSKLCSVVAVINAETDTIEPLVRKSVVKVDSKTRFLIVI